MTGITLIAAIVALLVALTSAGLVGYFGLRLARLLNGPRPTTAVVRSNGGAQAAGAGERTASSVAELVKLETARRHEELTPQFGVDYGPAGILGNIIVAVTLLGPPALERLHELSVGVRDLPAETPGRWRLVPGVRSMHETPANGKPATSDAARDLPVGEAVVFQLELTKHPAWKPWTPELWRQEMPPVIRLKLTGRRDDWPDPWIVWADLPADATGRGSTVAPWQSPAPRPAHWLIQDQAQTQTPAAPAPQPPPELAAEPVPESPSADADQPGTGNSR